MTGFRKAAALAAACPTCNILPSTMHPCKSASCKIMNIYCITKRPYIFIRNKKTYPYPSLSNNLRSPAHVGPNADGGDAKTPR
jgi:hypothetical protein